MILSLNSIILMFPQGDTPTEERLQKRIVQDRKTELKVERKRK